MNSDHTITEIQVKRWNTDTWLRVEMSKQRKQREGGEVNSDYVKSEEQVEREHRDQTSGHVRPGETERKR